MRAREAGISTGLPGCCSATLAITSCGFLAMAILDLFKRACPPAHGTGRGRRSGAGQDCPRSPSPDSSRPRVGGLAPRSVEDLLADNTDIIGRIKLSYGRDAETFSKELLPLIRAYLAYVNVLPATADSFFSSPGGLARLGLETGFFALQGTDSQIFAGRATISTRRLLEPRWRCASFIAGLCAHLHRALESAAVASMDGATWQPFLMPLAQWVAEGRISRLHIKWRDVVQETRSLSLFALPMIIPSATLADLAQDNAVI